MNFSDSHISGWDQEEEAVINVTPLIDVVFNLLIFFMVSTSFAHSQGLHIELPTASEAKAAPQDRSIFLTIANSGDMALDGKVTDIQSLPAVLTTRTSGGKPEQYSLIIEADKTVPHGTVVQIMNEAVKLKIANISVGATSVDKTQAR